MLPRYVCTYRLLFGDPVMTVIVKETTDWGNGTRNNYYALTDCKRYCVGYMKDDGSEMKMFTKKLNFDTRGRTFEVVKKVNE